MINLKKLEELFSIKYQSMTGSFCHEFWVDYCDEHKILLFCPEWVRETFNENRQGMVCIFSPETDTDTDQWLLVPEKFAEKCLVLGSLP
jgi:hypothetical protein